MTYPVNMATNTNIDNYTSKKRSYIPLAMGTGVIGACAGGYINSKNIKPQNLSKSMLESIRKKYNEIASKGFKNNCAEMSKTIQELADNVNITEAKTKLNELLEKIKSLITIDDTSTIKNKITELWDDTAKKFVTKEGREDLFKILQDKLKTTRAKNIAKGAGIGALCGIAIGFIPQFITARNNPEIKY